MTDQIGEKYKFSMGSLYELQEDNFGREFWMHVMKCSPRIKSLNQAIAYYEEETASAEYFEEHYDDE